MANEYATLAELKTHLRITNTNDDTELQAKLTAASRRVDRDTGRQHGYWQDSGTSQRTYEITHPYLLPVDDISTTTGLVVEFGINTSFTTVPSTYYDFLPENALADSYAIEVIRRSVGSWPVGIGYRARITAKWGWAAVPDQIKAATLLVAARLFRRKDSPEGVKGNNDFGQVFVSRYEPDYDWLIGPFTRREL